MLIEAGSDSISTANRENCDAFICAPQFGLFLVCDGVGSDGGIAARMVGKKLFNMARIGRLHVNNLRESVERVDELLTRWNKIHKERGNKRSLTTLSVLVINEQGIGRWANIGDSRIGLRRGGELIFLSIEDLSVLSGLSDEEKIVYLNAFDNVDKLADLDQSQRKCWDYRNHIDNNLGSGDVRINEGEVVIMRGDVFFLATDGLDNLTIGQKTKIINENGNSADQIAKHLAGRAATVSCSNSERKHRDDITDVVVIVKRS